MSVPVSTLSPQNLGSISTQSAAEVLPHFPGSFGAGTLAGTMLLARIRWWDLCRDSVIVRDSDEVVSKSCRIARHGVEIVSIPARTMGAGQGGSPTNP